MPLVSIIMAVYNGELFLNQAIDSILTQTFDDFEFIIINDGSTDASASILQNYAIRDARIQVYDQPHNMGLVAALNRGCNLATGRYIARMDADDISFPERLKKQVAYLEANPHVGILGTWAQVIDERSIKVDEMRLPIIPILAKWDLSFFNIIVHPSVMMRKSVVQELGYYQNWPSEDYELWARSLTVTDITNLPEYLFCYRRYGKNLSINSKTATIDRANQIMRDIILQPLLSRNLELKMVEHLRIFVGDNSFLTSQEIIAVSNLIFDLRNAFCEKYACSNEEIAIINQDVANKLYILSAAAFKFSLKDAILLTIHGLLTSTPSLGQFQKAWHRLLGKNTRK